MVIRGIEARTLSMETAASCTVCQVYLNNLSRSAQIDSLEWLVSI